jgi:hypothetical protein
VQHDIADCQFPISDWTSEVKLDVYLAGTSIGNRQSKIGNIKMFRRINVSAAVIVLICFFLPWLQVSCAGAHDSLSGFQLARYESALLWLVPILMLAVIAFNSMRAWKEESRVAAILSIVCGAVSALLMNRERIRANDTAGVISAQLTGWFWLSLISSVAIVASSLGRLLHRRRPEN